MKKLCQVVILLSLCAKLFAQGGVYAGPTVVNGVGQPIANASVYITIGNPCGTAPTYTFCNGQAQGIYTGTVPPAPLAVLYTDVTLGTTIANPVVTDPLGNWTVYTNPGVYWAVITGYQIVPSVQPVVVGNGQGGGGAVNCATALNGSLAAFTSITTLGCDQYMGTDFAGNGFAQSWKYLGPVNGFFGVVGGTVDPGTQAKFKLNANEVRILAPLTAPTPYYARLSSTPCTAGQLWPGQVNSVTTDANGDTVLNLGCANNGAVSITATSPIVVTPSPITGTGVISCPTCNTGSTAPQASNPSAPTLTTNGSAGTTSYSYEVVGCEDGPTCAYHSAASSAGTIATGNATLDGTNSINLKTYADTLYGYRCYNIYRTASAGTPSSTGLIASCVYKQFIDTGIAGDGTMPPSTNTTVLDANGLTNPLPGCNKIPAAPWGIDGVPCTPNAADDEFSWGNGTWQPGDANNPQWTQIHPDSPTFSLTNGLLSIQNVAIGTNHLDCVITPTSGTSYSYVTLVYAAWPLQSANYDSATGFYESSSGKFTMLDIQSNLQAVVDHWTSSTVYGAGVANSSIQPTWPLYIRLRRSGSNIFIDASQDGIVYTQYYTETVTTQFTTAPDNIALCLDPKSSATGITVSAQYDYFRKTQ